MFVAIVLVTISVDSLRPASGDLLWYAASAVVVAGTLLSLTLHELSHVFMARRTGGAVLAVEPPLFGALSDDAYRPHDPRAEAIVASAGPLASLALAGLCAIAWRWWLPDGSLAAGAVGVLALANLIVGVANALPGYPLDGGRVFRAFVWFLTDDLITGTRMAAAYGQAIALSCLILGALLLSLGDPLSVWGAWALVAFWAINRAGREGFIRTIWRETSKGLTIDDVGLSNSRRVDANRSIDDAIDEILQGIADGPILVRDGDAILGIVTLDQIRRVPRAIWPDRQIRDVTSSIEDLPRVQYDAELIELAEQFERSGSQVLIVETRGKITGALDKEHAIRRARERVRAIRIEQKLKRRGG
jgi:Zn-dependent protease